MRIARQWENMNQADTAKAIYEDLVVFVGRFDEELKDTEVNHMRYYTDRNDGYLKAMRWVRDELRQAGIIQ